WWSWCEFPLQAAARAAAIDGIIVQRSIIFEALTLTAGDASREPGVRTRAPHAAAAGVCGLVCRLLPDWQRARAAPRIALAVRHVHPDAERSAGDRGALRPTPATRGVRDAARRAAHHAGDHFAPGQAVRHPARARAARGASAPRLARG